MCGLAGFAFPENSPSPLPDFKTALKDLTHRGPDDEGFFAFKTCAPNPIAKEISAIYQDANLFLLFRRLSIIDLSPAGHQPMLSENGRFALVFNGEIYNFKELRRELMDLNVTFHSDSDSEVLLNAWMQWGSECLPRLIGMFSFAIYDALNQKIILARDAFGIKPLFYFLNENKLAFASEINALKTLLPNIKLSPDNQSAYDYLVWGSYDGNENSFYKEINQVPPAHFLEVSLKESFSVTLTNWWFPSIKVNHSISFKEATSTLRNLFLESVKLHLRSDVPLGAALSGGIDSSAIVCAMRYLEPELPIHTFSFIAENESISEEKWVDRVNEFVGAIPHKIKIDSSDLQKDIDNILRAQGEPFGSTSIYAQFRIYEEAKKNGVIVMLDGQGADELLAGYSGYPAERLTSLKEEGRYGQIISFLFHWSKWPERGLKNAVIQFIGLVTPAFLKNMAHQWNGKNPSPTWLNEPFLNSSGVRRVNPEKVPRKKENIGRRVPETLRHVMLKGNLISLLRHADRNSMHWSVESRVPFLTIPMAEFLLSLPESFLIDQKGRTKSVFREAMRGIVPDEILDRKDKIGFATPEKKWLLSEDFNLLNKLNSLYDLPFIHKVGVEKYIDDLKRGKRNFDFTGWRLLNFSKWTEKNMSVNHVNQKG
jgi:asparagine synthase (glutamine-hydrolysing)